MDERFRFIQDAQSDRWTMVELCARSGISCRNGYKWLTRYAEEGKRGLADRSRAPHHCPHKIRPILEDLLCEFRRTHPDWGARKLLKVLAGRHPEITDWPAASTAADLLARRGLVQKRRRRRMAQHPGVVPVTTAAPNDLWTADFKGQFRTGNGVYCFPLTIDVPASVARIAFAGKARGDRTANALMRTHRPGQRSTSYICQRAGEVPAAANGGSSGHGIRTTGFVHVAGSSRSTPSVRSCAPMACTSLR